MIDLEALLIQILLLATFGVVYAWIGGKIGFKSGIKAAKKELFSLFEIDPETWGKLSPKEKRDMLIKLVGSLIQDTLKQASEKPNSDADETQGEETETPLLPDAAKYTKGD